MVRKLVITGGPSAGKTNITRLLASEFPDRLVLVPESATAVYERENTHWTLLDTDGRRGIQRRMYHYQLQNEELLAAANPGRILLLDRGTVDGATYWPDGPEAFFKDRNTSLEAELARYDVVVWLETVAVTGEYRREADNEKRFESAEEAIRKGLELLDVWGQHPRFHIVPADKDWERKVDAVRALISQFLPPA